MISLPKTFTSDSFTLTQRVDLHPVYIYEKAKGDFTTFEVIKARRSPERVVKNKRLSASWVYPRSEDWGLWGWSCPTMESAWARARRVP
jgi:hypothetical protein